MSSFIHIKMMASKLDAETIAHLTTYIHMVYVSHDTSTAL